MLMRAAVRSFRHRPPPIRIALPVHIRSYAKNNVPRKPTDYHSKSSTAPKADHVPAAQSSSSTGGVSDPAAVWRSSDRSGNPDYSTLQDEFKSGMNGEENTTPSSSGASPGPPRKEIPDSNAASHTEYSELQDEFQTTSSPDQNTTPQDTSPSAIDPAKIGKQEEEVRIPLHDLTKGIPSTLDAELAQASSAQSESTAVAQTSSGGRGDRQLPASAYITSAERRRNRMMNWMFAGMFLFGITGSIYLGRNWETEEEEKKHPDAPSGWGLGLFYNRAKTRLASTLNYYNEPAFRHLLPDAEAWERQYTLVISLEDLLIHSEWTREHGWRMAKRPGMDYFIRYLSQYYEIVLFTSVPCAIAAPIAQKLDPFHIIMYSLFREATLYKNGEYIKDLSYLNRPLEKTILVDTVPSHAKHQPENAIIIPKWTGDPNDKELVSLIPFLENISSMQFPDVRKALASFDGKHIPTEFAIREQQAREKFQRQLAAEKSKRPKRSGATLLTGALGIKTIPQAQMEGETSYTEAFEQGKMWQDQVRERGLKQYEWLDQQIRENGEKWLKEQAAEEEKMKEEQLKGMKQGFLGWFGIGGSGKEEGKKT